jgi:hypothetical protein
MNKKLFYTHGKYILDIYDYERTRIEVQSCTQKEKH